MVALAVKGIFFSKPHNKIDVVPICVLDNRSIVVPPGQSPREYCQSINWAKQVFGQPQAKQRERAIEAMWVMVKPSATPTPEPVAPTPNQLPARQPLEAKFQGQPPVSGGSIYDQYVAGYQAAGVMQGLLSHFLNVVVPCESHWHTDAVNPRSGALGLSQFLPGSWNEIAAITGYWNWRDPFSQGYNTAKWASITSYESQWSCW